MTKPLLLVVTGRPASGKTTLAHLLSKEIKCPLLSRDELKEGYINTINLEHDQLDDSAAWHIYNAFFEAIDLLISKGISVIVEAAFQNKLWKPKLLPLAGKAEIKIIICETSPDLARSRFAGRLLNDPGRNKYHGDKLLNPAEEPGRSITERYEPVNIDTPTLEVDTTENYSPDLQEIIRFIRQDH
jgi:predicted kinase